MTNPAGATHQLVGLFDRSRVSTVAAVLGELGARRALVVHGCDGLDELTLAGPTHAALWNGTTVDELTVCPEDVGIARCNTSELAGGEAQDNAAFVRQVLGGSPGPRTDVVRLNAGASLWVSEAANSLREGVELATTLMQAGAGLDVLDRLIAFTQGRAS